MKKIDLDTVDTLQLLAPGKSRNDAKKACGLILSGQAFAEFSDEDRRTIWNRMKNFDGLIPSLYTFFEDFKYLESCVHCVKRLYGPSTKSVWEAMRSIFVPFSDSDTEESVIQTSECTFRHQRATDMERLETGYLQVWLYAMRHYPLMPPDPKKDDDLLAKPARAKADARVIYEMAELAHRLGFKSPEIDALIDGSPDHQIARAALLQARKPNRFRYDAQKFEILVSRISDCFAEAVPDQPGMVHDLLADSTVKPRARCGMPQTRTHKQDSPMLFLDHLHADDVGVADTITSFFVRRCVFFAFFGKPAQPGLTDSDEIRESPEDVSSSPLFIGEDDPSGEHVFALQADLPRELPQQEQEEPLRQWARQDGEQQTLGRQQVPRGLRERGVFKKRRTRKVQMRRRWLRPTSQRDQHLMELESTESSDQDMSDQGCSSQELPDEGSQGESVPIDSANALTLHSTHGPATLEEADTYSHCTRISFEAAPLEQDSGDRQTIEGPHQDDGLEHQARIDHPSQPQSTEFEGGNSLSVRGPGGQQQALDEYLGHLMRAQEEQQRLEEKLENERLEEELGLFNQEQPVLEPLPRLQEGQKSPLRLPDNQAAEITHTKDPDIAQVVVPENTQDPSPASRCEEQPESPVENPELVVAPTIRNDASNQLSQSPPAHNAGPPTKVGAPLPLALVEISFWAFEREEWKQSDCLRVDPSDPSPVERTARKYSWKDYSLYDRNLQSISPSQCYRAATVDGNNAIFLISESEEQKLAAEGRLTKERRLLSLVSRVLDRAESEPKSTKRQRPPSLSVLSEEL